MNKQRHNRLAAAIICGSVLILCSAIAAIAQVKQKIPAEFLEGIFHGVLQGAVWDNQPPRPFRINFTIDLYGHDAASLAGVLTPYGLKGGGSAIMSYRGIPRVYFVEGGKRFYEKFDGIYLLFDVGENPSHDVLTVATPFAVKLLDGKVDLDDGAIIIDHVWSEDGGISGFSVKGMLYKVNKIKKTFPKDIKPNEPIKTDKKTQIEITFPDGTKMTVDRNTEVKIEEIKETTLSEVFKGKIRAMIEKLKVKGKFEVHTPTCIVAVRGTEYAIDVNDDGITTLIVLDGEVELKDINKKKTVLVTKNQQVVVKSGEFPPLPVQIDPDKILRWWK